MVKRGIVLQYHSILWNDQFVQISQYMERYNQTSFSEFILSGLTNDLKIQVLLFVTFTLIYMLTLLGNVGIATLIWTDPLLHTPMYFFLSNLSCVDLLFSTSVAPKMLIILHSKKKTISFPSCAAQLFSFSGLGIAECFLLGVMAYDRYVAICKPLLYPIIMNQTACVYFVCATYVWSFLNAALETSLTFRLSFCRSNVIDHFFCDFPPLLKLSCSDISTNEVVLFVSAVIVGLFTCVIIMTSYCYIICTILGMESVEGRSKAFSTCASHVTVVSLFYGTIFIMYLQPASSAMTQSKVLSLFYTVVVPMLNPMIYSLRNQEVKGALRKLINKCARKWIPLH